MTGVTVKHRFTASAERVYDAWLDPEKARKFLYATATGEIVRCEVDARVGGKYVIVDRRTARTFCTRARISSSKGRDASCSRCACRNTLPMKTG
jgi:uncharacterized protein YndB with AHSA1/START domain